MQKLTVEEILAAPWWNEFLKLKDTWSWSALESRFDVRQSFLRNALAAAGLTKPPQPPGRKPKGWAGYGAESDAPVAAAATPAAPAGVANDAPSAEALALLGKSPDGAVAAKLGVTADVVKRWRREAGIDPFRQPPPGRAAKEQKRPESVVVRKDRGGSAVVRTERHAPASVVIPTPAPAPAAPRRGRPPAAASASRARTGAAKAPPPKRAANAAPAPSAGTGRGRASTLDRFREHIGRLTDSQVAAMAGVTPAAVTQYRRRRDIPPAGRRVVDAALVEAPVTTPPAAVAPPPSPAVVVEPAPAIAPAPILEVEPVAVPPVDASIPLSAEAETAETSPVSEPAVAPAEPSPQPITLEPVAAPVSVAVALPTAAPAAHAFGWKVKARNPAGEQVFVVIGTHIADAVARACTSLAERADGPWEFVSARRWMAALA